MYIFEMKRSQKKIHRTRKKQQNNAKEWTTSVFKYTGRRRANELANTIRELYNFTKKRESIDFVNIWSSVGARNNTLSCIQTLLVQSLLLPLFVIAAGFRDHYSQWFGRLVALQFWIISHLCTSSKQSNDIIWWFESCCFWWQCIVDETEEQIVKKKISNWNWIYYKRECA